MPTLGEIYRSHPSRADIDELLPQRLTAASGHYQPGRQHSSGIGAVSLRERKALLETASSTRKARNLAVNPQTSLLVVGGLRPEPVGKPVEGLASRPHRLHPGCAAPARRYRQSQAGFLCQPERQRPQRSLSVLWSAQGRSDRPRSAATPDLTTDHENLRLRVVERAAIAYENRTIVPGAQSWSEAGEQRRRQPGTVLHIAPATMGSRS
jgi:hypothetical protein